MIFGFISYTISYTVKNFSRKKNSKKKNKANLKMSVIRIPLNDWYEFHSPLFLPTRISRTEHNHFIRQQLLDRSRIYRREWNYSLSTFIVTFLPAIKKRKWNPIRKSQQKAKVYCVCAEILDYIFLGTFT